MNPAAQDNQPPKAIASDKYAPVKGAKVKASATNTNSTQNSLEIAEIRDGVVIMDDGSFRSVVMAKSVNFDLMSHEEQEAIEFSYQGFINSLFFPIQIFIRSQRIDMSPYIDNLEKLRVNQDNMLLSMLMADYMEFIERVSEQANIMNKNIYIVIPYFPKDALEGALTQSKDFFSGVGKLFSKQTQKVVINEVALEKAKSELRNRVQSVLSGLQPCGVQGIPLDTQELIELYYDMYNPDTATTQHLPDFSNVAEDVISKGTGPAPIMNGQS